MKYIMIYNKCLPTKLIKTSYGIITYYDFLCKEKEKFESHGRKVKIKGGEPIGKSNRRTNCCMYANNIISKTGLFK